MSQTPNPSSNTAGLWLKITVVVASIALLAGLVVWFAQSGRKASKPQASQTKKKDAKAKKDKSKPTTKSASRITKSDVINVTAEGIFAHAGEIQIRSNKDLSRVRVTPHTTAEKTPEALFMVRTIDLLEDDPQAHGKIGITADQANQIKSLNPLGRLRIDPEDNSRLREMLIEWHKAPASTKGALEAGLLQAMRDISARNRPEALAEAQDAADKFNAIVTPAQKEVIERLLASVTTRPATRSATTRP